LALVEMNAAATSLVVHIPFAERVAVVFLSTVQEIMNVKLQQIVHHALLHHQHLTFLALLRLRVMKMSI